MSDIRTEKRKDAPVPCERCLQTGHVCHNCNKTKYDCQCGIGNYSPVVCPVCDGEGFVA